MSHTPGSREGGDICCLLRDVREATLTVRDDDNRLSPRRRRMCGGVAEIRRAWAPGHGRIQRGGRRDGGSFFGSLSAGGNSILSVIEKKILVVYHEIIVLNVCSAV